VASGKMEACSDGVLYDLQFKNGWVILEAYPPRGGSSRVKTSMSRLPSIIKSWHQSFLRNEVVKRAERNQRTIRLRNQSVQDILDFYGEAL